MTVTTLLFAALAVPVQQKKTDMRVVDVKPAGLSVSVPKSWVQAKKDNLSIASFNIPLSGKTHPGRLDIGYVESDNKDVDGFLDASKTILTQQGNTIERQWKVDILDAPLALTRFAKEDRTTVRGVLFRTTKAKLVLSISSQNEDFSAVEPYLMSTLETLKTIALKEDRKKADPNAEQRVVIHRANPGAAPKLPVSVPVTISGKNAFLHFPAGTKIVKAGDLAISAEIPGSGLTVTMNVFPIEGNNPSLIYQTKASETADLFKGAITRIDESYQNNADRQNRDMIWRNGTSTSGTNALQTCDCVITQTGPYFIYAKFSGGNAATFKSDRKVVTKFLLTANLTDKP